MNNPVSTFTFQFSKLSFPNLGWVRFPQVTIPSERFKALALPTDTSEVLYLKHVAWNGYLAKKAKGLFTHMSENEVIDRLRMEFEVFIKTGTTGYIALIYDILNWCDQQGIARGPARGSCAASFVFYCTGITKIDPIRFGLTFTRFISEARVKPKIIDGVIYADGKMVMDVDIDVSYTERERVIEYIRNTFPGRVCSISNRMGFSAKTALKEVCKAYLGYHMDEAERISDHVEVHFGKSPSIQEVYDKSSELQAWVKSSIRCREAFEIALAIEDVNKTRGKHASGIFISYDPLDGNIPTQIDEDGETVTVFDMDTAALVGIKVDLLALRNMTVIDNACKALGFHYDDIDVNHPSIYKYLGSTNRYNGLFQISKGLTAEAVFKIKPRNIDHLGACIAISRPGAYKQIDPFAAFVNTGAIQKIHPAFDALLSETGNILLYQEQINEVLQRIYGISAVVAEEARRAIGKKIREDLLKFEPMLYECGEKKDIPKEVTKQFWDVCNASADYLFNKSHSVSYSYITAYTTFLKANYPDQFNLELLRMSRHEVKPQEALLTTVNECLQTGIVILPPDIVKSQADFALDAETKKIRFGLSSIKGISDTTMAKLSSFRRESFSSKIAVFEAAKAAGIPINILSALILSGCLSWRGESRTKLALEAQTYNLLSDTQKVKVKQFAPECNEDIIETLRLLTTKVNEKGKPLIPPSQMDTLRRNYAPYWEVYQNNSRNEEFCSFIMEKHYLGYSYTSTLFRIFSKKVVGLIEIDEAIKRGKTYGEMVAKLREGEKVPWSAPLHIVGFIQEAKLNFSQKNGSPYYKMSIADDSASILVMIFGEDRVEACKRANEKLPVEGDIVTVEGTWAKDGRLLFGDTCIVHSNSIGIGKKVKNNDI